MLPVFLRLFVSVVVNAKPPSVSDVQKSTSLCKSGDKDGDEILLILILIKCLKDIHID
jgi:hypothetical protein